MPHAEQKESDSFDSRDCKESDASHRTPMDSLTLDAQETPWQRWLSELQLVVDVVADVVGDVVVDVAEIT